MEVRTRGLSKKDILFQQNIYQISSHNAILFIPDAFIPEVAPFQITGAIKYISKVQIYTIDDEYYSMPKVGDYYLVEFDALPESGLLGSLRGRGGSRTRHGGSLSDALDHARRRRQRMIDQEKK